MSSYENGNKVGFDVVDHRGRRGYCGCAVGRGWSTDFLRFRFCRLRSSALCRERLDRGRSMVGKASRLQVGQGSSPLASPQHQHSRIQLSILLGPDAGLSFSREADSKLNLLFELGSQMNFQFSRAVEDLVFGVNLVALAAFIYLIKASKETAALGTAAGSL